MEKTKETIQKGTTKILDSGKNLLDSGKNLLDSGKNLLDSGKTIVSKTLSLKPQDISKKIFDNMIWVVVLVGCLILIYLAYLLTQSFNIDSKIKLMETEYKIDRKVNLETPSESGQEQEFDEIKINKHTICDVFICSSAKSYLSGRQVLDYVSKEIFFQNIKLGARYVELDLFEDKKGNIVVSNGLIKGNWILTLNTIYFEEFCRDMENKIFNKEYTSNYDDPFILYLNLNIDKKKMDYVAKIIENTFKKFLLGDGFTINGSLNVLETTINNLLGKIIIITDGKIANTNMLNYVHLRVGNKVKRMTYKTFLNEDMEKLRHFNKTGLSIVVPNPDLSSVNYNTKMVFEAGCQISALNFQYIGDYMKAYLARFQEKSFILKPFEFTKFSDLPQKGYDPNKIAYYENYEILKQKGDPHSPSFSTDYNNDKDSIFFKNNIGYEKPILKHGCCKIIADDEDVDNAYPKDQKEISITNMLKKLTELNIHPVEDYKRIIDEDYSRMSSPSASQFRESLNISETPAETPSDLKYEILLKQMKKVFKDEREKLFHTGMKDPCLGLDDKCSNNPICYFKPYKITNSTSTDIQPTDKKCNDGRIIYKDDTNYIVRNIDGKKITTNGTDDFKELCENGGTEIATGTYTLDTKCESSLSSIPYPKLCLPKYISPNRNMCISGENIIKSKGLRQILHETMTNTGFSGKWNSFLGPIVIPNTFNNQCEFSFTTDYDGKIFTMFLVNDNGENFNEENMIGSSNNLRAKGTFVDPELRKLEKKNKYPEMPYHGFIDIKMAPNNTGSTQQCENSKFQGKFKYSDRVYKEVYAADGPLNGYKNLIEIMYDDTYDDNGLFLGLNKDSPPESVNSYCYKVLSSDCLDQMGPSISFERVEPPSYLFAPKESEMKSTNLHNKLKELDLEFSVKELNENPKLKKRLIGMVGSFLPNDNDIEEPPKKNLKEQEEKEKEKEKEKERKKKEQDKKKKEKDEIAKKAELIYYNTSEASGTIKKPGDTLRIEGYNGNPFCIQKNPSDIQVTNCEGDKCDSNIAYIADCKNSPEAEEPFCDNIDIGHFIEFVDNGSEGNKRIQNIRSIDTGSGENTVDICLSYNSKGDVLYSHCNNNKNKDDTINKNWRVVKKKEDTHYRIKTVDDKCLTRTPFEDKEPEKLKDGLYEQNKLLNQYFASTKIKDCGDDKNQLFAFKYMGDTKNCNDSSGKPKIEKVEIVDKGESIGLMR